MGVHFLTTYMEKEVRNGSVQVNILELAKPIRRDKYLVIDLSCLHRQYARKTHESLPYLPFIQKLKQNGIQPIFVRDGPKIQSKLRTWAQRKYKAMNNEIIPFFESIGKFLVLSLGGQSNFIDFVLF